MNRKFLQATNHKLQARRGFTGSEPESRGLQAADEGRVRQLADKNKGLAEPTLLQPPSPDVLTFRSGRGFTLIEILIVVFIIGLLSSIVLVGLGSFRARGRDARRIADLRQTQNGLELYYGKFGSYPAGSWAGLEEVLVDAEIGIINISDDPLGDTAHYQYGTNGQNYVLGAKLEDSNNQVLKDDIDGSGADSFGVDCGTPTNDQFYCIKF